MKRVCLIPPAEGELTEAFDFYQTRAPDLGSLFLACFQIAVKHIQRHPSAWPIIRAGVRQKRVTRFPYAVLYREYPDAIVVLAVMHLHRRPGYWADRL
jgi:hypothetical protein